MGILSGGYAQDSSSPYQAVVARDGSGDYTSVQDASMLHRTIGRSLADFSEERVLSGASNHSCY